MFLLRFFGGFSARVSSGIVSRHAGALHSMHSKQAETHATDWPAPVLCQTWQTLSNTGKHRQTRVSTVKHGQALSRTGQHTRARASTVKHRQTRVSVTHRQTRASTVKHGLPTVRGGRCAAPKASIMPLCAVTQERLARTVTQLDERLTMMRNPLAARQRASRGLSCPCPFPAPLHTFDMMH